jgi:GT2 family glycosyltransferase
MTPARRAEPRVSFVIPVRNDAARLKACLQSIAASDYPANCIDVIVVVDKRSDDRSEAVARGAGATVLSCLGSVAGLRNRGARATIGATLAFVDADHVIDRGWIRAAVRALAADRVAAAGADYATPPNATWVQRQYGAMRRAPEHPIDADWLGAGSLAVRRGTFQEIGGFDASLETCEDVDLCQRLQQAGHRVVFDPAMRSVHFGDPATLRGLFFGELWRGRSNLRVTLRGPLTVRHLRSAVIPIVNLMSATAAAAAISLRWFDAAAGASAVILFFAALRAARMLQRQRPRTAVAAAQALAVALVYDVARALALVIPATHRTRRGKELAPDVIARSNS